MDVLLLSRIQFAFTASFHYLFPPMTIGLGWMLIIMEGIYVKTKNPKYKEWTQFWMKIFALFFAMGVSTGFIQLFAFGNNWSSFSKFVGDVFGTLLAAEGVFAFFLEAGFIGVMLFGWDRVKPWFHYLSTILVSLGATFSATWIVMANSWMQTPAGFKVIGEGANQRCVITNLWDVYFNPSFLTRLGHVLLGCGLLGVFLMISMASYYMLRKKHLEFSRHILKLSLIASMVFLLLQLWSGDSSASGVSRDQPIKLAAMEGVFHTEEYTPFSVIGVVDMENETVRGFSIPGLLSFLTYHNFKEAVPGLNDFPKENWPHVPLVFYSYKTMIYSWGAMMLYAIFGLVFLWRGNLEKQRWFLFLSIFSVLFPYAGNLAGWFTAEAGRQPWVVYNVMRTHEGLSKVVTADQVYASLIMFAVMFSLLLFLFLFLLSRKILHGPENLDQEDEDTHYRDVVIKKT